MRGERERKVHEPRDAEAEHPEEHPRADRPRRGLPRESGAAARVEPERDEQRDLREHPVDVEEAVVALRPLDEVGAEDRVDVDPAERQVVRDGGGVEEECGEREPATAITARADLRRRLRAAASGRRELLGLRLSSRSIGRHTGSGS